MRISQILGAFGVAALLTSAAPVAQAMDMPMRHHGMHRMMHHDRMMMRHRMMHHDRMMMRHHGMMMRHHRRMMNNM